MAKMGKDGSSKIRYSVVIPVYNSENEILELNSRIKDVFKKIDRDYEIIFVNDFSIDKSANLLKNLANDDPKVKFISLSKNFGQQNTIFCGFHFASGDYIITMDDDIQYPPEEIPRLIDVIKKYNYDLVYGQCKKEKDSLFRKVGSAVFDFLISFVIGQKNKICSMRIIKRLVIEKIIKNKNYHVNIDAYIFAAIPKIRIGVCSISHNERKFGHSNYSFMKLIRFAINFFQSMKIVKMSNKPQFEIEEIVIHQ